MNTELLNRIKKLFENGLMEKTNWGRNQIMKLYNECVNMALMEQLNKRK